MTIQCTVSKRVCVCTFQPGNFPGWGSAGVKPGLGQTIDKLSCKKQTKNKQTKTKTVAVVKIRRSVHRGHR